MTPPAAGLRGLLGLVVSTALLSSCAPSLRVSWERNMLAIEDPARPGEKIEVWYLEAFCRSGSTRRAWEKTVIPHRTELLQASPDRRRLRLRSEVEGGVEWAFESSRRPFSSYKQPDYLTPTAACCLHDSYVACKALSAMLSFKDSIKASLSLLAIPSMRA
jgi:hypothetical protein